MIELVQLDQQSYDEDDFVRAALNEATVVYFHVLLQLMVPVFRTIEQMPRMINYFNWCIKQLITN